MRKNQLFLENDFVLNSNESISKKKTPIIYEIMHMEKRLPAFLQAERQRFFE